MLLEKKVCLLTGTNRGIGAALLEQFVKEGAIIYANARQEGVLDDVAKNLNEITNGKVIPVYFDIRDTQKCKSVIQKIYKDEGKIDVLVNNAGIMQDALIGMIDKELMREIFETNVFASMDLLQFVARTMKRKKSGSIINFSSIVGQYGNKGQLVYSASKGAVIAMTKTAAKELAPYNIRVNAVAPGMIDTEMFRSIGEEKMAEHLKNIGMGRFGTPEDVAKVVVMLASDYTEYVTGQILGIDGEAIV